MNQTWIYAAQNQHLYFAFLLWKQESFKETNKKIREEL